MKRLSTLIILMLTCLLTFSQDIDTTINLKPKVLVIEGDTFLLWNKEQSKRIAKELTLKIQLAEEIEFYQLETEFYKSIMQVQDSLIITYKQDSSFLANKLLIGESLLDGCDKELSDVKKTSNRQLKLIKGLSGISGLLLILLLLCV